MSQLCDFPVQTGPDCCTPTALPPAAPIRPSNAPRLGQVAYRIGTFGSFRRAMLDALATLLPGWRQAEAGQDYATMFIELWAYIADVLTFYQERIANEAYIGTATQRDSLLRLAQLIDYRANPGAAAAALLAFKLEKGKAASVPTGLRVSSKPSAGRPAAIFETDAAIQATAAHNAIPLARSGRANQFVTLDQKMLDLLAGKTPADPAAVAALFPEFASVLGAGSTTTSPSAVGAPSQIRTVFFQGLNLRLRPGDWLLVMADQPVVRQISSSQPDPISKTTAVSWLEPPQWVYSAAWTADPAVYAFRAQALPFGHDVPDQTSLVAALIQKGRDVQQAIDNAQKVRQDWLSGTLVVGQLPSSLFLGGQGGDAASPTLPEDPNSPTLLHLDRVYDGIAPSAGSAKSMVVLLSAGSPLLVTEVVGVDKETDVNYGLRARVTRLTLRDPIKAPQPQQSINARDVTVLVQSEQLSLANVRPLPDPLDGSVLPLDGLYPDLAPGQRVIVQGTNFQTNAPDAEDALIETVVTGPAATKTTLVSLHQPLGNQYFRAGALLLANIAPASQGEKVRDEVMGSGDGSAWQTYTLRKSPLTYVQAPAQASEAAVVSTLQVIVGGVMWSELPNLLDAGAGDRVYFTREDAAGKTSVLFGDGIAGVRPPTGKDNIHARYRKGLGLAGNVDAGAIAQMVDSVPGIQSVSNPEPAIGGADAETEAQLRTNAPAHLRTFNRAVAIDDFASLARSFPGVEMASASWQRTRAEEGSGGKKARILPHPVIGLTIGTANGKPLSTQADFATRLRRYLDLRRDVNVPLALRDYDPVYVDFAATIDVDDAFGRQATLRAAIAALNYRANADGSPAFFASFGFGESVHLSAVYAALQAVPGVKAATVTRLRHVPDDTDPALVRSTIPVGPTARALIGNDPADTANAHGKFALTLGSGGFAD